MYLKLIISSNFIEHTSVWHLTILRYIFSKHYFYKLVIKVSGFSKASKALYIHMSDVQVFMV